MVKITVLIVAVAALAASVKFLILGKQSPRNQRHEQSAVPADASHSPASDEAPPAPPAAVFEYRVIPVGAKPEQVINEVIEITRRRLQQIGVNCSVRKTAPDMMTVELPKVALPLPRVRAIIESIGTIEFRTVCSDEALIKQARDGNVPAGYRWYAPRRDRGENLLVNDTAELTGQYISKAAVQRNTRGRELEVAVLFNPEGQRVFGKVTGENINERLAIILGVFRDTDGRIIEPGKLYSAPVIKSAIWGSAIISGRFTQAEAEDFAAVLQAGALPAKLELVNENQAPASAK